MMQKHRRYWLIVTEDRAAKPEVEEILELAAERGVSIELRVATKEDDGGKFAREGVAAGADAVIAAGGDGTVNAVMNGLMGSSIPLGIIPLGTANDFAQQAGIPGDPREALEIILGTEPVPIDTASLNGRHFLNVSSGGIGAETTAETSDELKAVLGPLAYAITGVRKLTSLESMRLVLSGAGDRIECEALIFAVGNARTTGGGNLLTPRASLTDGLLDVCIVEAMPVTSLLPLLLKMRNGEHLGEDGVRYLQAPAVTITSPCPVSVNVDGEPMSESRLEYRAHSESLRVHLNRREADNLSGPEDDSRSRGEQSHQ
jgi:lipid kinase YegS